MNKLYQFSSDFVTNSYGTVYILGLILWEIMSPSSKQNEIYGMVYYLWEWPHQEKTERALKMFLSVSTD